MIGFLEIYIGSGALPRRDNTPYIILTINYQLSIINYQLSTINYQLSTINYQLSTNSLCPQLSV